MCVCVYIWKDKVRVLLAPLALTPTSLIQRGMKRLSAGLDFISSDPPGDRVSDLIPPDRHSQAVLVDMKNNILLPAQRSRSLLVRLDSP